MRCASVLSTPLFGGSEQHRIHYPFVYGRSMGVFICYSVLITMGQAMHKGPVFLMFVADWRPMAPIRKASRQLCILRPTPAHIQALFAHIQSLSLAHIQSHSNFALFDMKTIGTHDGR